MTKTDSLLASLESARRVTDTSNDRFPRRFAYYRAMVRIKGLRAASRSPDEGEG